VSAETLVGEKSEPKFRLEDEIESSGFTEDADEFLRTDEGGVWPTSCSRKNVVSEETEGPRPSIPESQLCRNKANLEL
jgi:hypothetical protein